MELCTVFEQLYGKDYCNINLHLHGHLVECVQDYDPVYAFWLFGFEQLNGVMGSLLSRHIITINAMDNWPSEYKDDLAFSVD